MIVSTNHRTQWSSSSAEGLVTNSIANGEGIFELTTVSPDAVTKVPLRGGKRDVFTCAVGIGAQAPADFAEYARALDCDAELRPGAIEDATIVKVVEIAQEPFVNPQASGNIGGTKVLGIDYTTFYIFLVYLIVVSVPSLVCFWNISKVFDERWRQPMNFLSMRGVARHRSALLVSAAPLAGLLAGYIVSIPFLVVLSLIFVTVSWQGRGFLAQDAAAGLAGSLIFWAIHYPCALWGDLPEKDENRWISCRNGG
ncbi:hypothetical protein [Corynebacterium camporealensis]|nr:hypothetical protein [Corynebacterium camporealensis]